MRCSLLVALLATTSLGATATATPRLPAPSGRFRVGTSVLGAIADPSRPDSRFRSGERTVVVQLWYPTRQKRGVAAPYPPDSKVLDQLISKSSTPDLVASWRDVKTSALLGVMPASGTFPLVVFSQGVGMPRFAYTSWLQELASRGNVVASIDHPDIAPALVVDDRIIEGGESSNDPTTPVRRAHEMAADINLVVNHLSALAETWHIDTKRVAVVGHSLGGAAALEVCRNNAAIDACVDIDGDVWGPVEQEGVGKPFLVVLNEPIFTDADLKARGRTRSGWAKMQEERKADWRVTASKQTALTLVALIMGTGHLSFTDAPFVHPGLLTEGGGTLTDPARALRGTVTVIENYISNVFAVSSKPLRAPEAFISIFPLQNWAR